MNEQEGRTAGRGSGTPGSPTKPALLRRLYAAIAGAGVVFGAIVGGLSLVDWLQNHFDDEPPAVIDARISAVRSLDFAQPLGDYLRETRQPSAGYTRPQLDQRGYVFGVRLVIRGLLGRQLYLRWSMYRVGNGGRLRGPTYNQFAGVVKPASARHARTVFVWSPAPQETGMYFLRFVLEDDKHQPVSDKDTRPFKFSSERATR